MPVNSPNFEWATYYTVHLHDNSMPSPAELPLATVLAAARLTRSHPAAASPRP
ncbi:MAG: hypothetical protein ACRDTC_08990 [Pseudonocardiaceae bacterium]